MKERKRYKNLELFNPQAIFKMFRLDTCLLSSTAYVVQRIYSPLPNLIADFSTQTELNFKINKINIRKLVSTNSLNAVNLELIKSIKIK